MAVYGTAIYWREDRRDSNRVLIRHSWFHGNGIDEDLKHELDKANTYDGPNGFEYTYMQTKRLDHSVQRDEELYPCLNEGGPD